MSAAVHNAGAAVAGAVVKAAKVVDNRIHFNNWVLFTATHNGRDKLLRLVQYASKLAAAQLAAAPSAAAVIVKPSGTVKTLAVVPAGATDRVAELKKLSSVLSTARKLFRFGKFAEGFKKSYDVVSEGDFSLPKMVALAKALTTALYLVFDSWQWIHDSGVHKYANIQQIKDRRQTFYALSIFFGFVEGWLKLQKNLRAAASQQKKETSLTKAELMQQRSDIIAEMVKNALDLPVPLSALKYIELSDSTVGLLGTITSCIALRLVWPTGAAKK